MTITDIHSREAAIIACAKSFREDANRLMNMLANEYNFSWEPDEIIPREVFAHKYLNKGKFQNEWSYYFHGSECRWDNLNTGQIVEIIIITRPEFGFLDGYFFYNYMATTKKYLELATWFGNYTNVWDAIEALADKGVLKKDLLVRINRNIIAL